MFNDPELWQETFYKAFVGAASAFIIGLPGTIIAIYKIIQTKKYESVEDRITKLKHMTEDEKEKSREEKFEAYKKQYDEEQKRRAAKKNTSNKSEQSKSVLASILLSVLGTFEVHLIYGLTTLVLSLVFLGISYIPVLNVVADLMMIISQNTYEHMSAFIATVVAYIASSSTIERIAKNEETRKLSLILSGAYLSVSNVLFVMINLIHNDSIMANVFLAIAGVVMFCKGKFK